MTVPVLASAAETDADTSVHVPLNTWITDGRDQFAIQKLDVTEVSFLKSTTPLLSKTNKTECQVKWSPLGSYLVSTQPQGVTFSGGDDFTSLKQFVHPGVKLVDVSSDERFMTTWSPFDHPESGHNLFLWDVETGLKMKSFNADVSVAESLSATVTQNIGTAAYVYL